MKKFQGEYTCGCGATFNWQCVKLDSGDVFLGNLQNKMFNCVNVNELTTTYLIELLCPDCSKRDFVNVEK